jgi:hypothetical protein
MARLDKPSRELLTAEDFESYPVWVWDDRNDACLPLDDVSPAYGQWDPMFIAASITAGKAHLKGYVVGDGLNVYAFAVFFGTAEFSFNLNMGEDFFVELRRLAAEVG